MHGLALLAVALPALAVPFQPESTLIAGRAESSNIDCSPPFPKAPYRHAFEAIENMHLYQPIDANNNPITTSTGKSSKRQESIDDKLDFLGKQRMGDNAYENSGRRTKENPKEYEVKGKECTYISAVGQAAIWICNDSKDMKPISFRTAEQAASEAIQHCAPDTKIISQAQVDCMQESGGNDPMPCYDEAVVFGAQAWQPDGWNMIIRKNDGIAPSMPNAPAPWY